MTITVPVTNEHKPGIIVSEGYSAFQFEEMKRRVEGSDFDFVCNSYDGENDQGGVRRSGPFFFMYFTKDRKLHAVKVGQKRVLREIVN